jgi:hypothetical protein
MTDHTNRLSHQKSPYLLQHAHNPVDWFPWGAEAFEKARREDKPIFLSVGYSTCHWCHVMARESFENQETARVLNEHVVSIKVDREERPDLDMVFMSAVQQMTGRGGWPMTAFLLPDGRPFAGGTYFTPNRFRHVIMQAASSYRQRRADVERAAAEVVAAVQRSFSPQAARRPPRDATRPALDDVLIGRALDALRTSFDAEHGGFGAAPKFPPHGALPLLFHQYRRTEDDELLGMATRTLDAMALGGVRDHLGGGFHRYSSDAQWLAPHFEKMLYDNALLAMAYVEAYSLTQDQFYREIADGTYDWVAREMTHPAGGFYAALDAESDGVEGKYYLWRKAEVIDLLGAQQGELFCRIHNVEHEGNYADEVTHRKTGANILHMTRELPRLAQALDIPAPELNDRMCQARANLLAARQRRPPPHCDDKVITAWNGLMIASLAYAGRQLDTLRYTEAAERAAEFVHARLRQGGRLLRRWRDDEARFDAYLDDYVCLAWGLLELSETTGSDEWLERARELMDAGIGGFADDAEGGFFYTGKQHEPLFARPKEVFDHPIPSSNAIGVRVLIRLSATTGEQRYTEFAERALRGLSPWMSQLPRATESLAVAAAEWLEARPA